ncbi:Spy/CpxP family protein refolding chaperone [Bacteroidota bacterium]
MKTLKIKNILIAFTILLMAGLQINAQEKNTDQDHPRFDKIHQKLDLTEDQATKIEALKTEHMKELLQSKNTLNELKAKQQTLASADKADMKAINANIDEITSVENKMMKLQAKHHQDVRALLTDKQRVIIDSHGFGREHGHGLKHEYKGHHLKLHQCKYFEDN